MNEPNWPEKPLRSWQPRPPSRALKRNIFSAAQIRRSTAWFWGCLAPAAACALLALANFNSSTIGGSQIEFAMISSNQFCTGESGQSAQNRLASVTFDWTNHSSFQSSIGFTPVTNLSN